ncbi:MAG: TIGR00159 family protein [Lentisphaerae bacterium]|nr:TIGR00159 family protein [Lentisphaerota bacterium]
MTLWMFIENILPVIKEILRVTTEFLLIAFVIYKTLYYLRGTRAANVLAGLIVSLLLLYLAAEGLQFKVISWLLQKSLELLAFALIVIFQPELRRSFAQIGSWFSLRSRKRETISDLVSAINSMAGRKCGAIVVIERRIGMRAIVEDAVKLDCKLNALLLQSIFYPNSPLHDGAVIIREDRIVAARAILPLSRDANLSRTMGTRHRAALGITEETDAAVVVVSEETGDISIACQGEIMRGLSENALVNELNKLLMGNGQNHEPLTDIFDTSDEQEGDVNFHGDEDPASNDPKPEAK